MLSRPRLRGALDALFAELSEVTAWEAEIAAEARRAATRRDRLAESLRCAIGTLAPPERAPELSRLHEALGHPRPAPIQAKTERVRLALDWLSKREAQAFDIADLAAHLHAHGHRLSRGYLPALLTRWVRAGLVTRRGQGRYRVEREVEAAANDTAERS